MRLHLRAASIWICRADSATKTSSTSRTTPTWLLDSSKVKKGPDGAVKFCNISALPLTDSISLAHGAKIRRVTDKPRNPLNKANEKELVFIADFKEMLASGNSVEPILDATEGQVGFYYPITTNAMCLQCHGVPEEQIATSTLAVLHKLYPKDMAQDYQENEVRGLWAINFKENNGSSAFIK